ncbi:cytochrome c-type biogenesis protein CcmH [Anaerobacillus isosaccharinicus]|uniref:Cytochrome c-type biogenesis protein n=2 Tax=Anaerobacillus isosaccharinicus TaxID=1532552 RepID=A0A1S2M3F2_9BACI|nr:cytochrome c-type biogenesis protein CcmH [Anaerobacillus isosaccharinicus]
MKWLYGFLVLVVGFISFQHIGVTDSLLSYDINSPEVKEIASKFSMQGHADHDISTCSTKQTYYNEIAELLNEGKTKAEIFDYYLSMYGEEGLRVPKKEGFSLLAWTTPFMVLTIAGVGLFIGVGNMINKQEAKELVSPEKNEEDAVEAEITSSFIDEERKKMF